MAVTKTQAGGQVGGVAVNDIVVITEQGVAIADYDVTWTANAPTPASTQTIADGTVPTVAELGQAVANIEAKLNVALAMLRTHGLIAT